MFIKITKEHGESLLQVPIAIRLKHLSIWKTAVISIVIAALCITANAQLSESAKNAMSSYLSAIETVKKRQSNDAVERAFAAARTLKEALLEVDDNDWRIIERISEEDYNDLERQLNGILINREEVILAEPETDFWVKLADEFGNEADTAFFKGYKFTYPDSVWAIYMEQQTDVTGCSRFGSMKFVEAYKVWSEFSAAYPNNYKKRTQEEIDAIFDDLTGSTCPCGTTEDVIRELERFNEVFPGSRIHHKLQERINKLKANSSEIRNRCISG